MTLQKIAEMTKIVKNRQNDKVAKMYKIEKMVEIDKIDFKNRLKY